MLLIHGAWQGSWSWAALLPQLDARGWRCHAIDLPGNGSDATAPAQVTLDLYVAHVARVLDRLEKPAVVVAHSGGGVIASQLAEARPQQVAALVYVAGMMLPDGLPFARLIDDIAPTHPAARGIGPHLEWSPDRLASRVPAPVARDFFFHDCTVAAANAAIAKLTAQPEGGRAVAPRLSAANYGRVPRAYIETARDRSVLPVVQQRMLALSPGAQHARIDSGHVPQLTEPAQLAGLIEELIAEMRIASPSANARAAPRDAAFAAAH